MSINSSVFLHQRYQYFSFVAVLNSKRVLQEEKVCNYKKILKATERKLGLCGETQLSVVAQKKDMHLENGLNSGVTYIYLDRI